MKYLSILSDILFVRDMTHKENFKYLKKGFLQSIGSILASSLIMKYYNLMYRNKVDNYVMEKYKKLLEARPGISLTNEELKLIEYVHFPDEIKRNLDFVVMDEKDKKTIRDTKLGTHNNYMLYGVPGTGKTVLCKAICKTLDLIYIDLDGVKSKLYGETEKNVLHSTQNILEH